MSESNALVCKVTRGDGFLAVQGARSEVRLATPANVPQQDLEFLRRIGKAAGGELRLTFDEMRRFRDIALASATAAVPTATVNSGTVQAIATRNEARSRKRVGIRAPLDP